MDPKKNSVFEGQSVTGVGDGYNTLFNSAMPSQIAISAYDSVAAKYSLTVSVCSTTSELNSSLGIQAGVAVNTWAGNFQTRVDFAKKIQTSAKSVTILVFAEKISGGCSVRTAQFAAKPNSALELYRQGGDSYVSQVTTGGYYIAAFNYATYDETTYQNVKIQADTDFSGWADTINAQFLLNIEKVATNTGTTSKFNSVAAGFTPSTPIPTDSDGFVEFINTFSTTTMDEPEVFDFEVQLYQALPGCPDGFDTIRDYLNDWVDDSPHITRLANILEQVEDNLRVIQQAIQLYNFYGCIGVDDRLSNAPAVCTTVLEAIDDWRESVDKDPTTPGILVPQIEPKDLEYPEANWYIRTSPGGPGGGGGYFEDISPEMIPRLVGLRQISAKTGDLVDQMSIEYTLQLGDANNTWNVHHGGQTGGDDGVLHLSPSDRVTAITTKWWDGDSYVKSIHITTQQQSIVFGNQNNPPNGVSWTKADNTCFVGFAGRCGTDIDSLSAQYVQFLSCTWTSPDNTSI